ncbi:hypothetical protein ACW5XA_05160 [Aeromonas dhakensis]|uniref:hypothetical protein n=1 Tax=Aeromonas dhakensis TaxID=196024 RepID=UPI0005A9F431|nr:hypothetical protein [Aeromonas dhakensis]
MNRWQAFKKRAFAHVTLFALFLVFIIGAVSLQIFGNDTFSALGANLLAESIGAAATVYGIDFLIKQREEKRLLPVKAASYEDVRVMTHWALDLWRKAYEQSVGDSVPNSWADLFSEESLAKIQKSLDITKHVNTLPSQPWGTYFDGEMDRICKHAEKVLERHGGFLEPEIHNAVYTIVYYNFTKISHVILMDKHIGIPRPTNLGGYAPMIRAWFDAVLTMHDWTAKIHPYLTKNSIVNIHPPYEFSQLEIRDNPPAQLDDGVYMTQVEAYLDWQEQQKAKRVDG